MRFSNGMATSSEAKKGSSMELLQIFAQNLVSPAILFFGLGITAGLLKSDLDVPESISRYLSIYLMMAIGFKGGVAMAGTPSLSVALILTLSAGFAMSLLQPFLGYSLLKATTKLDRPTLAAIAGTYGSVSIVTFVTATSFLTGSGVAYEGYMVAVLALMEAPAILAALFIAHRSAPETITAGKQAALKLSREIFTNGAILLLFGSFLIGWLSGKPGLDKMEGFLVTPFQGILALFMLDMGIIVSRQLHHMRSFTFPLAWFGIYMPMIGAAAGLMLGYLIGLDAGTGALFMVLCASASYIAVPAAMRLALPQAKAAIFVPMSLAITFPFNIVVGIPIYLLLAQRVLL
jgi:uncharacterized protein